MKNLQLHKLQQLSLNNSLPHAWLFSGGLLEEKLAEVNEFVQWLLCSNKSTHDVACGNCKSCKLFTAQTHPDFKLISPQPDKVSILIDDVRDLSEFIVAKPQLSQNKVVLLYPAEGLNKQAANSLLKNLEEPAGDTIFLLLARHTDLLLKTIVSRCQVLNFAAHSNIVANDAITQIFADLQRLWVQKNMTSIQLVDLWIKRWANEVLYWFELVLADLIRFKYTQNMQLLLNGQDAVMHVAINQAISAQRLWEMLQRLRQAQSCFGKGQRPNLQLIMEDILLE